MQPPEEPRRYQAQPYQPGVPQYGGMNEVQTSYTRIVRPPTVVAAAVVWLLAALAWPLGRIVVRLAEGDADKLWWTANVFLTVCVVAAVTWPVVRFLQGSFQSRLVLTLVSLLFEVLAFAFLVSAIPDTDLVVLQVIRLVLPPVAIVLSFLPGSRGYFAANLH